MENNILPDDIQKKVDEVAQRYESPAIFKEGVFYAFACAKIMAEKELSTLKAQQGGVNWVKASERLPDTSGYYHVKRKVIKSTEQEKDVQYYLAEASRFSWDNVIWWLDESPNAYQELKPYDELYRLVFSNLAKLRARCQNNERMVDMADNIRAIIEDVTNKMQAMPQPEPKNDPWQLRQSANQPGNGQKKEGEEICDCTNAAKAAHGRCYKCPIK